MKKIDISELWAEYPNNADVLIHIDDDLYEITALGYIKEDNLILLSITDPCPCCGTHRHKHD